jgi:integrase/recombinase XerD
VSGFRPSVAAPPAATIRLSALRVVLPGGLAYWTVVDEKYELVEAADGFLRDLRFGADRAESTTRLYASELALFLDWSTGSGRDLERAGRELSGFVLVLRTTPVARRGRGFGQLRSPGRINHVLSVVREFYKHAVAHRRVSASVIAALYEVGDDRFLPAELRAEDGALRYRVKPRHQLRVGRSGEVRACDLSEWEALLRAAGCWRDRFLLVLLWFSGLRIGEALGLRRSDLHLMTSASELGCRVAGAHLHVVPRENVNGARAKGRRERVVPLTHYAVSYYDLYLDERERCRPAQECDFVFVNLWAEPLGAPMRYGRVAELFRSLSRRAELGRAVTPHMLRHAAGSALTAAGGLDVAQAILGHASITSTQIYVHASAERQRDAVERLSRARARRTGALR